MINIRNLCEGKSEQQEKVGERLGGALTLCRGQGLEKSVHQEKLRERTHFLWSAEEEASYDTMRKRKRKSYSQTVKRRRDN